MCAVSSSTLTPSYAARYWFARKAKVSACAKTNRKGAGTYNKGEERIFFHLAARLEEDVQLLGRLDTCGLARKNTRQSNRQSASLERTASRSKRFTRAHLAASDR